MQNHTQPTWVTPEIIAAAQAHAIRTFPLESCGIVTKTGGYVECENHARDPINAFEMNPTVWLTHLDILGVIHSHTNGNYAPGEDDMTSQIATGVAWGVLVATVDSASVPLWWGGDTPIPKLLGREFIHGIQDCYSLIRDWYRLERKVTIPEYPRDAGWWEEPGKNMYETGFRSAGFYQIPTDPMGIQVGDVFFCKVRSRVENHGGLYIGNGLLMHHVGGHLSLTTPASHWQKLVTRWVRYGEQK